MLNKAHVLRVVACIEIVDVDLVAVGGCEEMAAMAELDLTAVLDGQLFEWVQLVLQDVHHPDSVGKADDDVEAAWVEGNAMSLFLESLTDVELSVLIVPDSN